VYSDSLFAFAGHPNENGKRKSIFNYSGIGTDTFDKSFRFEMGRN
jgi:hypothetical protein